MSKTTVHLEELPYQADSCVLFERIRELPRALMLDSGHPHTLAGRFDILTADPCYSFDFSGSNTMTYEGIRELFLNIARVHSEHCGGLVTPSEDIPFCGGIAGALDYGLGKALQSIPAEPGAGGSLHFYSWAVVQDHLLRRCTFASLPTLDMAARRALLERLRGPDAGIAGNFELLAPFRPNMDRERYRHAFGKVQDYILDGDCYQVNLARRFSSRYRGEPWQAYRRLRPVAAAHFAGYMKLDDRRELLCLSPERFLKLAGRHVETRPIKGTRPRHPDAAADRLAAEELRRSAKDRAENLMIVDLLRNDIGRNCIPGSIRVDRLFELESYPAVHHLVSTVSGELLPDRNACDLLRDSFPGGSITGAPKRRAMQIIEELEPDSRSSYCGSMLYISADGRMDSNIAIRSLVCKSGEIHCWGGGGIVADSEWEREYREIWDKVGRFVRTLENGVAAAPESF